MFIEFSHESETGSLVEEVKLLVVLVILIIYFRVEFVILRNGVGRLSGLRRHSLFQRNLFMD